MLVEPEKEAVTGDVDMGRLPHCDFYVDMDTCHHFEDYNQWSHRTRYATHYSLEHPVDIAVGTPAT